MSQLILLHGFTGSGQDWQGIIPALPDQYHAVAPDIIGHGRAASPADVEPYHMEAVAEVLLSSVQAPFNLLGYSMGGRLALYVATHYPDHVHSLILESASPGLKTEAEREARRNQDSELADKIEANGIEWFVNYWETLALWDSQSPELKARLHQQRLRNDPVGLASSLRGMGTGVMPSLWDKLSDLNMPVKLIVGELDSKFLARNQEMVQRIPGADLSIVEGAGHAVHLERSERFTSLVLQFLRQNS